MIKQIPNYAQDTVNGDVAGAVWRGWIGLGHFFSKGKHHQHP
jgi:hypothetical protein